MHLWKLLKDRIAEMPERQLNGAGAVALAALVVFCQQAWVRGFFFDGHLYAAVGRNVAEKDDWLVPSLSQTEFQQYFEHPPLPLWVQGVATRLFGASYVTARLSTSLFSVATVLVLYALVCPTGGRWWAFFAGLVLALTPPFIKTSAYPNPDVPLTFFITLALACYFQTTRVEAAPGGSSGRDPQCLRTAGALGWAWWAASGLAFGLALLCKGPPALAVPLTMAIHLLLTGSKKTLASFKPWMSWLIGATVFGLWPFLLWRHGQWAGFEYWWRRQVSGTILQGRGQEGPEPWLYLVFLLKTAAPWLLLAAWGGWLAWKERREQPLGLLFLAWLAAVFVPFSLVTFKYSRYILPLYPALAGLAAYPALRLSPGWQRGVAAAARWATLLAAMALLIFPITVRTRREADLFKMADLLAYLPEQPTEWAASEAAYGYWSFTAFAAWQGRANAHRFSMDSLAQELQEYEGKRWLLLVTDREAESVEASFPDRFRRFLRFPHKGTVVLLDASLWTDGGLVVPRD
ncbi:MAG: glycosyltransferase family 39 protein [Planctomycetes bacterium]|nr:glycosyltransferase family 39 protein [Planctomycetota bacterium]